MKKLLIVVDYQNDFVDGALGFEKAKTLDAGIAAKVKEFTSNDDLVIFTFDTHSENYLQTQEGKNLPIVHCIEETHGWNIYGQTGKALEEIGELESVELLNKETFGSDVLLSILNGTNDSRSYRRFMRKYEAEEISEVHLCGVVTNMCVISNAVIAKTALPEAKIVIHADLCASFNEDLHNQALNVMEGMQMEIVGR